MTLFVEDIGDNEEHDEFLANIYDIDRSFRSLFSKLKQHLRACASKTGDRKTIPLNEIAQELYEIKLILQELYTEAKSIDTIEGRLTAVLVERELLILNSAIMENNSGGTSWY
jgi:hypothetical protein